MNSKRVRRIACVALVAMLFSAMSPAFAAVLFSGRADVLSGMLAMPVISSNVESDVHHDHAAHHAFDASTHEEGHPAPHRGSQRGSDGGTDHSRHGVFCSLCLASTSTVTLLHAPVTVLGEQQDPLLHALTQADQFRTGACAFAHHPRDPPR